MRRFDRRGAIQFVDLTSAKDKACPIDRGALLERFHASEDGVLLSGASAFAAMWRAIPMLRPLGLSARVPLVLAILERSLLGLSENPTSLAEGYDALRGRKTLKIATATVSRSMERRSAFQFTSSDHPSANCKH